MNAELIQRPAANEATPSSEAPRQRWVVPAHDVLLRFAALAAGERVVDVACGAGLVTFAAAEAVGITGMVFGVDPALAAVRNGRARARERGCRYVWFERGAAERVPLPGDVFDAALCAFDLMRVASPRAVLSEMMRLLAHDGRAVAAVWTPRATASGAWRSAFDLGTGDRLAATFRDAGFVDVRTVRIDGPLDPASVAALGEPSHEARASIVGWQSGDSHKVPGEFVIARGRKAS